MASVKANPNMVIPNKSLRKLGFLETAVKKPAKTIPIPVPTPANAIDAKPAPIVFEANKKEAEKFIVFLKKKKLQYNVKI
jgi:hypothetical protein